MLVLFYGGTTRNAAWGSKLLRNVPGYNSLREYTPDIKSDVDFMSKLLHLAAVTSLKVWQLASTTCNQVRKGTVTLWLDVECEMDKE